MDYRELEQLYIGQKSSVTQISKIMHCSPNKVIYWMDKHSIKRRSISEAIYQLANPKGDPFLIKQNLTPDERELLGMGLGLYWGEGAKTCKHSLKLGNTDPALILMFMEFLTELYGVKKERLKFYLQIFTDIDYYEALDFWTNRLGVLPGQFARPTVTISGSIGTYKRKSQYGVVTVCFHNKKLRDIIMGLLPR